MKPLLASLLALAATNPAFAQVQYDAAVDQNASAMTWSGTTSLGAVKGNKNFNATGTVTFIAGSASAPFGTVSFKDGSVGTNPTTLYGYVDNPIPFFPPIAEIWISAIDLAYFSGSTPVNSSSGAFAASITPTFNGGTVQVDALGTTTIIPLAGTVVPPFTSNGSLTQNGSTVTVHVPVALSFSDSVSGITFTFGINGDVYASAPVSSPTLKLTVSALVSNTTAYFDLTGGLPNTGAYIGFSVRGLGSTSVPKLGVTLDIAKAKPLFLGSSDANGDASWSATTPNLPGLTVWFQGLQTGITSNVSMNLIQ